MNGDARTFEALLWGSLGAAAYRMFDLANG